MSRSGYTDECENIELYRGAVESALRGKRGQRFVKQLTEALDAMTDKRLVAETLVDNDGCCTLGALALRRGFEPNLLRMIDTEDTRLLGAVFDIAPSLAAEVMFENDLHTTEFGTGDETPEQRWTRMRKWARLHMLPEGL